MPLSSQLFLLIRQTPDYLCNLESGITSTGNLPWFPKLTYAPLPLCSDYVSDLPPLLLSILYYFVYATLSHLPVCKLSERKHGVISSLYHSIQLSSLHIEDP